MNDITGTWYLTSERTTTATQTVPDISTITYPDRLQTLRLQSLVYRRVRGDMIETNKYLHNVYDVKREDFFPLRSAGRRGHQYTITKQYSHLNSRKYFFSQRVVNQWNRLPSITVCAETVNRFKNQIDPMLWQHGGLFISQRRLSAPVIQTRRSAQV